MDIPKNNLYSTKLESLKEMDEFLYIYNLPKLSGDEINTINRPVISYLKQSKSQRMKFLRSLLNKSS